MESNNLFTHFVEFTAAVHRVTHDLTINAKIDGITRVQYGILEYLYVSPPVTLSEISECQHLSLSNTSREIKKLNELHFVEKFENTNDRRKQYIRLSNKGQQVMTNIFRTIEKEFFSRLSHVTEEEQADIQRAFKLLQTTIFR